MSIAPVSSIQDVSAAISAPAAQGAKQSQADFVQWLEGQFDVANQDIQSAEQAVRQLSVGGTDNLHQVMLSLERARLSLELVVQVRNRLVEAYQEVMRLQV